ESASRPSASPLLVLDRAPLVAGAAEQIPQARHDVADPADPEAPGPVAVLRDPPAPHLVHEDARRQRLEGELLPLAGERLHLAPVEERLLARARVDEGQRMARPGRERAV